MNRFFCKNVYIILSFLAIAWVSILFVNSIMNKGIKNSCNVKNMICNEPYLTSKKYKLSDFSSLREGLTIAEVNEMIGKPSALSGSGGVILQYDLKKGGSIFLNFGGGSELLGAHVEIEGKTWDHPILRGESKP